MTRLRKARTLLPAGVAAVLVLTGLALLLPRASGGSVPVSRPAPRSEAGAGSLAPRPGGEAGAPLRMGSTPQARSAMIEGVVDEDFLPVEEETPAPAPTTSAEELFKALGDGTPGRQAAAALQLRRLSTPEVVEGALRRWHTTGDARLRALLLYVLSGTRAAVENSERDALLTAGAVPFLRDVVRQPAGTATAPAILALSDLGTEEAARTLTAVAQDPREPAKAGQSLSALIARPDRHAVAALEAMAHDAGSRTTHVRAVGALVRIAQTSKQAGADAPAEWHAEARAFVRGEGLDIVRAIAGDGALPEVQRAASEIQAAIESLP